MLTPEEKRQRKVERVHERFKELRLAKCVNQTAEKFQKLVRRSAIEADGKLTCCSCGKRDYPGNHFDAGHWIGRASKMTIFDARNCHPQCHSCNRYPGGLVSVGYDKYMRERYGQQVMDELIRLGNQPKQWTREELAELYVGYLEELNKLGD